MAAPPPTASRKSPSAASVAANLGRHAIHVVHLRLVQEGGQRDRLDAFGPQRGGNFAHHAVGDLRRQAADQKRPAAERSPQDAHLAAPPPAEDDPRRGKKVVATGSCP